MESIISKQKNIHNLRLFTVIIILLYSMMQKITVLDFICSNRFIPLVFLGLSAIIFILDFFTERRMFKSKYIVLPIMFIVATGISALINIKYGIYSNAMIIIYLVIEYAIFYSFEGYKKTADRDFKIISYIVTLFSLALSIYTYISYLLCLEYLYRFDNYIVEQGYQSIYRRAWGCYYETNWQGITALLVIYLCFFLILNTKKIWLKIINIINIVFHVGILVLTGSRSTVLSVYISFGVFVWYISLKYIRKYNYKQFKEHLIRLVAGIIGGLVCYAMLCSFKTALPRIQKLSMDNTQLSTRIQWSKTIKKIYKFNNKKVEFTNPSPNLKDDEQKKFQLETIERLDIESKDDKLNGRIHVWKDGLKLWLKRPFFGTSPGNMSEFTYDKMPNACEELLDGTSLRNGYLDVIVKGGFISSLIIFLFLILCAKHLWKYQQKILPHRTQIGIILASITSVLVFIIFSSDLFYYRSSLNYLFILLLGYGMSLIESDYQKNLRNKKLFVCDTPYQIVQSVTLAQNLNDTETADIYIYNQFNSASKVAENLNNNKIFDNVILFDKYKNYNGFLQKLVTLFRISFPLITLKNHTCQKLKDENYNTIYISFFTPFIDSVKLSNPYADIIQYEDGIGNYRSNELEALARSKFFNILNKYALNGKLSYNCKTIYLNHPEYYKDDNAIAEQIPKVKNVNILSDVFDYKESEQYNKRKVVYLTQPLAETSIGESADKIEKEILDSLKNNIIVRIHPRQSGDKYIHYENDNTNNLWELECANKITDDHVLIAAFSTAQFTPKMIYDKEPTVIFTYKLFGNAFDNADSTVEMLKKMYRNPEKVIVVENIQQIIDLCK